MDYKKRTEKELRAILGEPDEAEELGFVRCYNVNENWFISGDENGIDGSYNATDVMDGIERGFMECHHRSYEASMSAVINAITYKWCIIRVKMKNIPNMVESLNIYKHWNVSGGAKGIKIKKEFEFIFEDPKLHISAQIINEQK